jgi:phosphate transport system permease protein
MARKIKSYIFYFLCVASTIMCLFLLGVLLYHLFINGREYFTWDFLTNFPSRFASKAGVKPGIYGTFYMMVLTGIIAVPLGISTAIYLEEYAPKNKWMNLIQINISNLAGMPSIIYGLLGLSVFVRFFGLGRSLLSGALTLSLLILPVIIIASQGAIRSVPQALRDAGYALGGRKFHVVFTQVLPAALPGIMTGVILSLSRAIGESAPLIVVGAVGYISYLPQSIMDGFTVLPIQIYNWASRPQEEFQGLASAAILVLLLGLFSLNFVAVYIREHFQRYKDND